MQYLIAQKLSASFNEAQERTSSLFYFFYVENQFLSKLGDVTLGLNQTKRLKAYKDEIGFSTMKADKLGIGDAEIWYGKPDARIRANGADTAVVCPVSPDANGESDGTTVIEARAGKKNPGASCVYEYSPFVYRAS